MYLGLKGRGEGVNYFSVAKKVFTVITVVQHSYIGDMGGAVLHGALIRGVADGVQSVTPIKKTGLEEGAMVS